MKFMTNSYLSTVRNIIALPNGTTINNRALEALIGVGIVFVCAGAYKLLANGKLNVTVNANVDYRNTPQK